MNLKGTRYVRGFTLTEILLAVGIFGIVTSGAFAVYLSSNKIWSMTSLDMRTSHEASLIAGKMVYGLGLSSGIRAAKGATVSVTTSAGDWTLSYNSIGGATNSFEYDAELGRITYIQVGSAAPMIIGENIVDSSVSNDGVGLSISVDVSINEGRFGSTNGINTYVKYRN